MAYGWVTAQASGLEGTVLTSDLQLPVAILAILGALAYLVLAGVRWARAAKVSAASEEAAGCGICRACPGTSRGERTRVTVERDQCVSRGAPQRR